MPYITPEAKTSLDISGEPPRNPGELTYLLFMSLRDYAREYIQPKMREAINAYIETLGGREKLRYADLAAILGSLTACRMEWERREEQRSRAFTGLGGGVYTTRFAANMVNPVIDEFYAEVVAPYEDRKIEENGDVLPR